MSLEATGRIKKLQNLFGLDAETANKMDLELTNITAKHFGEMIETANHWAGELKIIYLLALALYIRDNAQHAIDKANLK